MKNQSHRNGARGLRTFEYLGLRFSEHRTITQAERDRIFHKCHSIGISNYERFNNSISSEYRYDAFYAASGGSKYDVFLCCGAEVVPGSNELFAIDSQQAKLFAKQFKLEYPRHESNKRNFTLYKDVKVISWARQKHEVSAFNLEEAEHIVSGTDPLDYNGEETMLQDFTEVARVGEVITGPTTEILDETETNILNSY